MGERPGLYRFLGQTYPESGQARPTDLNGANFEPKTREKEDDLGFRFTQPTDAPNQHEQDPDRD